MIVSYWRGSISTHEGVLFKENNHYCGSLNHNSYLFQNHIYLDLDSCSHRPSPSFLFLSALLENLNFTFVNVNVNKKKLTTISIDFFNTLIAVTMETGKYTVMNRHLLTNQIEYRDEYFCACFLNPNVWVMEARDELFVNTCCLCLSRSLPTIPLFPGCGRSCGETRRAKPEPTPSPE